MHNFSRSPSFTLLISSPSAGCLCVALYLTGMYCMVPPIKNWDAYTVRCLLLAVCQHSRVTSPQAEAWGMWEACRGGGEEKNHPIFFRDTLENQSWEIKLFYHPDMTKWPFQNQSKPKQIAEFSGKNAIVLCSINSYTYLFKIYLLNINDVPDIKLVLTCRQGMG